MQVRSREAGERKWFQMESENEASLDILYFTSVSFSFPHYS